MEANALYFPYIKVPKSAWFTRILLYWDKVGAIIPSDYIYKPEALGEHTRSLIEYRLVDQIFPGDYINNIPQFVSSFEDYLKGLGKDLDQRRQMFQNNNTFRIHMEKMGPIEDLLREQGLAEVERYPWFNVEANTADEFMTYLAGCLGQLKEIQSIPITDNESNLEVLIKSQRYASNFNRERNKLRMQILERIFPAPKHPLTAQQIEDFKINHGDKLRSFRRAVEREILSVAELQDPTHRAERIRLFEDEVQEQVDEIRRALNESGYVDTILGKLCPVISAIPGAHYVFSLANVIYGAFGKDNKPPPNSPLAYAAYAQVEILT